MQAASHPSSNRARHRAAVLIETNVLTTTLCCHLIVCVVGFCNEFQLILPVAELIDVHALCVQMVNARRSVAQSCHPPPLVCLEINEVGIKMSERTQVTVTSTRTMYRVLRCNLLPMSLNGNRFIYGRNTLSNVSYKYFFLYTLIILLDINIMLSTVYD